MGANVVILVISYDSVVVVGQLQ
uniref:Uncharacterized protein n=1 Tax=Arundo donax TaxID=35708 RepID=A0A0A9HCI4_ARUDO